MANTTEPDAGRASRHGGIAATDRVESSVRRWVFRHDRCALDALNLVGVLARGTARAWCGRYVDGSRFLAQATRYLFLLATATHYFILTRFPS